VVEFEQLRGLFNMGSENSEFFNGTGQAGFFDF
jgi:hypothetical protein